MTAASNRIAKLTTGTLVIVSVLGANYATGHGSVSPRDATPGNTIDFPDTKKYKTLVLDLHTHSVFSDGHVWPTIRVAEAVRDGLDGLAITEHLEWQPHITDIPHPDRNRSFQEASRAAQDLDLLVIPGVEITRTDDPGHINAVFVKDANELVKQRVARDISAEHYFATREKAYDYSLTITKAFPGAHEVNVDGKQVWMPFSTAEMYQTVMGYRHASTLAAREALEMAKNQGAFTFWNHPSFDSTDSELNAFHAEAVKSGLLQGIEVANGNRYYENAHRLALKHNLALIGVSDVHELIAWDYRTEAGENPGHRPVTLVLAKEDSLAAMKEALFDRRTVVWWGNTLIGREPHLNALLEASIEVAEVTERSWGIQVKLHNHSDAELLLSNQSDLPLGTQSQIVKLIPNADTEVTFSQDKPSKKTKVAFTVLNALIAPNTPIEIKLDMSK